MARKKYVYCTGSKGGIGKSTAAQMLVDYFAETGSVLLIDTDPANADTSSGYRDGKMPNVRGIRQNIRSEDAMGQVDGSGLMITLNHAVDGDETVIVIDAPAGDATLLFNCGTVISSACAQSEIDSIIVWLVDSNDKTPVNTLDECWEMIKDFDKVLLLKNYKTGTNFEHFDQSAIINKIIMEPNVQVLALPKLAARLQTLLRSERMNWKELVTTTKIGDRVEAQRIRKTMHTAFAEAGI